ncbi:ribosomal large subunit pseudouridine synthase D [Seinonella peptonophila]|uniref:Pseudouridine synthase n=1 Tax=Seinonella peptonophila TaxID=112248 RepID=A0A1M4UY65_9BACL|nr:RluA family pseudouridine synthase [Seinonella peptonophila]SHE61590.1 ribosomal large subunit pseudouridine synthase D [Seinonella peptonophila]
MNHEIKQWQWRVTEAYQDERLDKVIVQVGEDWSRSKVQKWIQEGYIKVDGKQMKSNYRLRVGEEINVTPPVQREGDLQPEAIPLDIQYEDDDLLVINKPRGMVVHPGAGNRAGTLVHALLYHLQEGKLSSIGGSERPGIVHRIDKDTSGLLVVAKNDHIHQLLAEQLQQHQIKRIYWALVQGVLPHNIGTIDAPIGRDPMDRKRMAVINRNSKKAVTHFTVRERLTEHTLVECQLETGRTHQIRVHFKYIGFPLVGDPVYGPKKRSALIEGQALHARELHFVHPRTSKEMDFLVEPPVEFMNLLEQLRKK